MFHNEGKTKHVHEVPYLLSNQLQDTDTIAGSFIQGKSDIFMVILITFSV